MWVSGLTLTGGYNNSSSAYGGAIYNAGASLNLQNVTIQNSKASSSGGYSCGGAIYSAAGGNLQAQSCSFLSDSVNGYYDDGGAIYMGGAVNTMGTIWSGGILCLNQCTFTGNSPGGSYPYGGAIYVGGSNGLATITNSSFTGNSAYYGGGAIYSGGNYSVSVSDSSFTSNSSNGNGYGGALYGGFMLLRDTLTGNAACQGGAWYGSGTMTDSTVMNNSATSDGGGIYANGNLTLTTSTVAGNTAAGNGGGISDNSSSYQVKVYQSTISGNRATGSSSLGGGINNYANETLTVVQSTVTLNQASQGGGLYNAGTATVQNTIIAGNTATGAGQDVYGAFLTTSAYNVIGIVNNSTGLGDDPNTRAGTTSSPLNARLAPLANNGGLTFTQMPSSLSPAVDDGSSALAVNPAGSPLTYDQRGVGFPRIIGSAVDVGAVEYLPTPSANAPPTIGSLSVSASVVKQGQTITLTANNVADDHGVASVSFYLDSNHNGVGDPTELLGTSTSGWTWTGAVTWGTGLQTYLAIATDDGYPAGGPLTSAWASVKNTVTATTSPQITLGTYSLNANQAGQRIPIYVTGVDQVTGFNLDAQIVGSSTPKFQSIDFTGGIWDSHPTTVGGGPVSGSTQYAQASVIFTNSGDQTQANGLLCTLVVDTTGYAAGQSYTLKLAGSGIGVDSSFVLYGGAADPATITNGSIQLSQASVVGRYVVYNNSAWDGNGDAVSTADNNAIATDKQALLPTQTATFANYTSYSRGINEIMIDIANLVVTPDADELRLHGRQYDQPVELAFGPHADQLQRLGRWAARAAARGWSSPGPTAPSSASGCRWTSRQRLLDWPRTMCSTSGTPRASRATAPPTPSWTARIWRQRGIILPTS